MKKVFPVILLFVGLLASCTTVEFKEPVPRQGAALKTFPPEIRGTYLDIDNKDTLVVGKTAFQYGKPGQLFHLKGNLTDGNTVLKKFDDYYILNVREDENGHWNVLAFTYKAGELSVYYLNLDKDTKDGKEAERYKREKLENLGNITEVVTVRNSKGDVKYYLIAPDDRALKRMFKAGLFEKTGTFKKIED